MRNIGDQWIEEIDGKRHMCKAVKGVCENCGVSHLCNLSADCPMALDLIAKDLGVLKDGLLPCPFCGEYPKIIHPTENMPVVSIVHTGVGHRILLEFFSSEQEAIDAWNKRN